jgi:N-acetylglucosamine-6-phosphate deacetylase
MNPDTTLAISGARILTPEAWLDAHAVVIDGGHIAAVEPFDHRHDGAGAQRLDGGFLVPGFIDVQVNGGGGMLFNDRPDMDGVRAIADAHRAYGTTGLLPTLISDDLAVVARAIAAVDAAIDAGVPGVVGIHLEGPFLNPDKRGIHDAARFRRIDAAAIELLSSLRGGVTVVTLAPELADEGMVAALRARGVVVAAGHSMADHACMARAIGEGLTGVTHLFNAMTQMEGRSPGVVGAALDAKLFCGLIADGVHVHPASMRVALAAAGVGRVMLVTDAMPTVGMADKRFTLGGREIVAEAGACRAQDGTLAGSDLDMAQAVRNAVAMLGVDVADASRMASATPARFLGLGDSIGAIRPGYRADFVHLDEALQVRGVWIGGVRR